MSYNLMRLSPSGRESRTLCPACTVSPSRGAYPPRSLGTSGPQASCTNPGTPANDRALWGSTVLGELVQGDICEHRGVVHCTVYSVQCTQHGAVHYLIANIQNKAISCFEAVNAILDIICTLKDRFKGESEPKQIQIEFTNIQLGDSSKSEQCSNGIPRGSVFLQKPFFSLKTCFCSQFFFPFSDELILVMDSSLGARPKIYKGKFFLSYLIILLQIFFDSYLSKA